MPQAQVLISTPNLKASGEQLAATERSQEDLSEFAVFPAAGREGAEQITSLA